MESLHGDLRNALIVNGNMMILKFAQNPRFSGGMKLITTQYNINLKKFISFRTRNLSTKVKQKFVRKKSQSECYECFLLRRARFVHQ